MVTVNEVNYGVGHGVVPKIILSVQIQKCQSVSQ